MNRLLTALRELIVNPGANPRASVILFTIVTILVLILIIMVVLLVMRSRDRRAAEAWDEWDEDWDDEWDDGPWDDDQEAAGRHPDEYEYPDLSEQVAPHLPAAQQPPRRRSAALRILRAAGLWFTGVLTLAAFAFGYVETGRTSFCVTACHGSDAAVTIHGKDAHSEVDCVRCHEDPLPLGFAGSLVQRNAHLLQRWFPDLGTYAGPVAVHRCESCHAQLRSAPVVSNEVGVRMAHRQPIDAGMSCEDCHRATGHRDTRGGVPMSACMGCHEGDTASSRCETCHTKDVGLLSRDSARMFVRTRLPATAQCGSCHAQGLCDGCHGIRMPHSASFKTWSHGAPAAFGGKQVCYRCHSLEQDCYRCHKVFDGSASHHGANWLSVHADNGYAASCDCHITRLPADVRSRGYCATCHPEGRPGRSTPTAPRRPRTPAPATSTPTTAAP